MYETSHKYKRTDVQRKNQRLSWQRSDKAFFASGACHILAYTFFDLHRNEGYKIIGLDTGQGYASHVYISDGNWAFDFNGWTKEEELLSVTESISKEINPNWSYKRMLIEDDLETFCEKNYHRRPAYFLHLPWERTYNFISQFSDTPPESTS